MWGTGRSKGSKERVKVNERAEGWRVERGHGGRWGDNDY